MNIGKKTIIRVQDIVLHGCKVRQLYNMYITNYEK